MSAPEEQMNAIKFAERMMTLLDRGVFRSTYKYAVIIGLMDICMERTGKDGAPPDFVTTRQLAEKVLELYWPHTSPYSTGRGEPKVLRQCNQNQIMIINEISKFRRNLSSNPSSPHSARLADQKGFENLVLEIECKLIEMPLPKVQVVGNQEDRFVYETNWNKDKPPSKECLLRSFSQGDTGQLFDNRILFQPNVANYLTMLNGLLRPLIYREWASMVAQFNKLEESQLERFLFGASRAQLSRIKSSLREMQNNRCFYCQKRINQKFEVDHFIPWSRHPDDGIDNLVVAHRNCNRNKSDFLAATEHVSRWVRRSQPGTTTANSISKIAKEKNWEQHTSKTFGVARAIYFQLPQYTRLWRAGKDFELLNTQGVLSVLG